VSRAFVSLGLCGSELVEMMHEENQRKEKKVMTVLEDMMGGEEH
jgi:hypothetical protein